MRDRAGRAGVSVPGLWARGCTCRISRAVWPPARVDQHARAPAVTDGQTERRPWSVVGERLRWLAPGRSGAADRGRPCRAIERRSADAPGRGPRPAGPAGLSPRAQGLWVRPAARWDSACDSGPRGSTSQPGGTQPRGVGPGRRPAGPAAFIVRARATGVDQPSSGTQPPGSVPRRSTSRPGGTEPPRSGGGGRPVGPAGLASGPGAPAACPAGLSLLARAAGLHQPPRRDSGSARGGHSGRLGGPAALSLRARGLGVRPASPAGLIVESRATGFDQPGRRETSSGRWTAWLSQLGGTHPAGAGLRDSTSRPGGTEPPSTWSTSLPVGTELPGSYGGVRPAGLEGLSLRAGCHGSRPAGPAGLSVLAQAAGVDQPSRRDLASGCGAPPASTARTEPPSAVLHQTARPDGASWRGPRGSTSWPSGTWPLRAGPRGSTLSLIHI